MNPSIFQKKAVVKWRYLLLVAHIIICIAIYFTYDLSQPNSDLGLIIFPNIVLALPVIIAFDLIPYNILKSLPEPMWKVILLVSMCIYWFIVGGIIDMILDNRRAKNNNSLR